MKRIKGNTSTLLPWNIFLVLFLLFFIGIRLIHLPESVNFGPDQGRDFLSARSIYTTKKLAFIGPPSQYSVNGHQFFFGPAPYYFILPALIVGHWSPLFISYYLIFFNAALLLLAFFNFNKSIKNKLIIYLFAFLIVFSPATVIYTRSYWNPYFMFSISTLLLSILLLIRKNVVNKKFDFISIGLLFGLGLQCHYSFILAIILSILFLAIYKRINAAAAINIIIGFVLGFLPLILYEIKSGFYNARTFFIIFTSHSGTHITFSLVTTYYFISLVPFFFFLMAVLLEKIKRYNNYLLYICLCLYIIWSLTFILQKPKYQLSYQRLNSIAHTIEAHHPSDFNIVDQLTTDNRALALRYIVTVDGYSPHSVEDYTSPKQLFIYSNEPLTTLLENPVYEIKSFLPYKKLETQKIDQDLYLYTLKK